MVATAKQFAEQNPAYCLPNFSELKKFKIMTSIFQKYLLTFIPFICFILGYTICNILINNKSYPTPNLIGITLHEAVLQTSPFHINIQLAAEKECPGVAHGTIISQKPAPGRLIKPHQSIVVIICKLPATQRAPNLQGLTEVKAQEICTEHKIKLKTYPMEYLLPTGTCIGQTPQKEQEVFEKKITCYLATDQSNHYLMPNLINKPLFEVLEFLQKHNININVFLQNEKIFAPYPADMIVILQKPLPGTFVNLKNEVFVQLEVSK